MNYFQIPYESDYSDDGNNKMGNMSQAHRPSSMPMMSMPTAPGMNMNQMQMPMGNMPQMSQIPMSSMTAMSYPMQGHPIMQSPQMGMMPSLPQGHQGSQMTMSPVSMPTMSQIPPGAVTPLNSTMMMPVMGGIDGSGMNVVVPDLQPLSSMSQMGTNNQMSQMSQMPLMQQQQQSGNRLTGGSSGGTANWMSYGNAANAPQMMPSNMWNYTQNYPNMQSSVPPQQQQQQQQQPRMKSQYDYATHSSSYREARNGLNSPTMQDSMRFSRNGNDGKKVPHWR